MAGVAGAWLAAVGGLALRPVHFRPAKFGVPLSPLTPAVAILATVHLIGARQDLGLDVPKPFIPGHRMCGACLT